MRRALLSLLILSGCYDGKLEQGLTLTCSMSRFCPTGHSCHDGRCTSNDMLLTNTSVTPAFAKANATITATFDAPALRSTPTVSVANLQGTVLSRFTHDGGSTAPYEFTWAAPPELDAGAGLQVIVFADITTAAGISLGHEIGRVTLDYVEPEVTSIVEYVPAASNPLQHPTELTTGTELRVTALANEPLADGGTAELLPCGGGAPVLSLEESVTRPEAHVFSRVLDAGPAREECTQLALKVSDRAGNEAKLGERRVTIDTLPPPPPNVGGGRVVYRREPDGTATRQSPRFTVTVNDGGLDEASYLVVTLPASDAPIVTPLRPTPGVPVELDGQKEDSRLVLVAAADEAGNRSVALPVLDVVWVGVNPPLSPEIRVSARPADTSALSTESEPLLQRFADVSTVSPKPSWRMLSNHAQVTTGPNVELAAVACDDQRRSCLLFGGLQANDNRAAKTWKWYGNHWHEVPTGNTGPQARSSAAMAYDTAADRYLLVGGVSTDGVTLDDVWEWNGETWSERPLTRFTGGARSHAMAYDSARKRVQLFGGTNRRGEPIRWLFELEPNGTWAPVADGGVERAREGHAMVYDERARRTLIIGGTNDAGGAFFALEQSDAGMTFTAPAPGPARFYHAAVYDPATGRTFVVRGSREVDGGPEAERSCQALNPATQAWDAFWTPSAGEPMLDLGCANLPWGLHHVWSTAVAQDDGIVVHGNPNDPDQPASVLLPRDGGSGRGLAADRIGPRPRWRHTMTTLRNGDILLVAGNGDRDDLLDDAWLFDRLGWRPAPSLDAALEDHAAVLLRNPNERVLVLGGLPDASYFALFDRTGDGGWSRPPAAAGAALARQQHAVAARGGRLIAFGGGLPAGNGFVFEPNTSSLTIPIAGQSWVPLGVFGPSERREAVMTPADDGSLLLFGGLPDAGTWLFTSAGTWVEYSGADQPSPRNAAAMAPDDGGRVIMFGGRHDNGALGDTWEFSAGAWSALDIADPEGDGQPKARQNHAVALGPDDAIVLFGGGTTNLEKYSDTWVLDRHSAAIRILISFEQVANAAAMRARLTGLTVSAPARSDLGPGTPALGATASLWYEGAFHELDRHDGGTLQVLHVTAPASALDTLSLRSELGVVIRPADGYPTPARVVLGKVEIELSYTLDPPR